MVRHTAMEWHEHAGRTLLTADFDSWCRQASGGDPQGQVMADEDRRIVARSFRALPARWRIVLWHTLVEEEPPHRIAARLGITPRAPAGAGPPPRGVRPVRAGLRGAGGPQRDAARSPGALTGVGRSPLRANGGRPASPWFGEAGRFPVHGRCVRAVLRGR
ncbi:hypothetical protein ABZW32_17090 [Streptomyces sp. NPDC004667]|uniref:RNA polymerase sigma factor n=1 Tax=Streptomyces sp. NPDC004667 TaxID=3154285 RepID=UPI0033A18B9F